MNDAVPHFVAIGASGADGLRDIIDLLRALPKQPAAVIMVVLHRPSDKIRYLRGVLAQNCDIPIVIAAEAEHLTPGTCYVGEPDGHLTLVDRNLAHLADQRGIIAHGTPAFTRRAPPAFRRGEHAVKMPRAVLR